MICEKKKLENLMLKVNRHSDSGINFYYYLQMYSTILGSYLATTWKTMRPQMFATYADRKNL